MGKPRDERSKERFQAALEEAIDMGHALVRLSNEIDWDVRDRRFTPAASPGQASRRCRHG